MQTGQKIASLRKNAGFSQDELAEKLFVSRELVSKWETGKRNPDYRMIIKLSDIFGISADEIFGNSGDIFDELSGCFPEDRELSQKQLAALLNSFIKELSKTERTIFISRYYYGFSSEETASKLGLRSGYIRKKLTVIRKKLTDYVKEDQNG